MSTTPRRYSTTIEKARLNLINYLEIQAEKPAPRAYKETSTIVVSVRGGIASILLEQPISKKSTPSAVASFQAESAHTCNEILILFEQQSKPLQTLDGRRIRLDKDIAALLFAGFKQYSDDTGRENYIGKSGSSKLLTIYPLPEEVENETRHTQFKSDIQAVELKIKNETDRMYRRRLAIDKFRKVLSEPDVETKNFEYIGQQTRLLTMRKPADAQQDMLWYYDVATRIQENTLDQGYRELLTNTLQLDIHSIYEHIQTIKELIQRYRNKRAASIRNMRTLEESLETFSYKTF